jgi:hypothetical protein
MLRRRHAKTGQVAIVLFTSNLDPSGVLNERGRPFHPQSVASMLA